MHLDGDRIDQQLWSCLRAYPSRPTGPWDPPLRDFWARAADHGVALLLAGQLDHRTAVGDPRHAAYGQIALALQSRAVLTEVLAIFQGHQIPCAPLKGPLLAARLYGEFTLRPTTDVDVLVTPSDLDRAVEALRQAGARPPDPASFRYHRIHHHHINAVLRGVLIEVHFRATSNFGAVIPAEPLLARTTQEVVDDALVPLLDPTDELVCLAVNAAAHRFRAVLLLDLRRLCERTPVDWREAERRAREWHVARATAAALVAAHRRAGLDLASVSVAWRKQGESALRLAPELPLHAEPYPQQRLRDLALQSILADSYARAGRMVLHNVARGLRRTVHRSWPALSPWHWAG